MDRVPLLVPLNGPLHGRRFQLNDEEMLTIGRSEDCDIHIDDPEISRHHASVVLHNAGVWIQDAGSRNGVFVNEKRVVRPVELCANSAMTIGEYGFVVEFEEISPDDPLDCSSCQKRKTNFRPPKQHAKRVVGVCDSGRSDCRSSFALGAFDRIFLELCSSRRATASAPLKNGRASSVQGRFFR